MLNWSAHPTLLRLARRAGRSIGLEPVPLNPQRLAYVKGVRDPHSRSDGTAATTYLTEHRGRLSELQRRYAAFDHPLGSRSATWDDRNLDRQLQLDSFRAHGLILARRVELLELARLRFALYGRYAQQIDEFGFLARLDEDGHFGAWAFEVAGVGMVSRDLLDSVAELTFLAHHLDITRGEVRILDIGAGYGRLAHRAALALPKLVDYACVDAVAESTFLCEFYTSFRDVSPPVRVIELPDILEQPPASFDLAVNVHSFSECPLRSIEAWLAMLVQLEIEHFFLVPNGGTDFLSTEADGQRKDFAPLLARYGFKVVADAPAIRDVAVSTALGDRNHHFLFRRG